MNLHGTSLGLEKSLSKISLIIRTEDLQRLHKEQLSLLLKAEQGLQTLTFSCLQFFNVLRNMTINLVQQIPDVCHQLLTEL